ncbi:hypothetical protein TrCOL_g9954 [Triparma columacea]|nr:hypothetical protein TrCOL_g9954 [Triparma columacea]
MQLASGVVSAPYPPISFRSYERFLERFGPFFHVACARAALCCFDDDTNCLHPWFHGTIPRSKGDDLIKNAELGSFLVRFSEAKPKCMTLVYRGRAGGKNIMIFNLGTCFGLTDKPSPSPHSRNASSPKSASSSSETFETISDFIQRHSKLKYPVTSKLQMICLDEMETEKVNKVVPKNIEQRDGEGDGDDDDDNDNPDHHGSTKHRNDDDDDNDDDDGALRSDASQNYLNIAPHFRSPATPATNPGSDRDSDLLSFHRPQHPPSVHHYSPTYDEPTNHYVPMPLPDPNLERPQTAKSPSHHFGADVDDVLAQRMSMLSTPSEGQEEIYGRFGAAGGVPSHSSHPPQQHEPVSESPYTSFGSATSAGTTAAVATPTKSSANHESRTISPQSASNKSNLTGNPDKTSPYSSFPLPANEPSEPSPKSASPLLPTQEHLSAEFKSFLESAKTALAEADFDACTLLLQALGRLVSTESFANLPSHEDMMSQYTSLLRELESNQRRRDILVPEVLDEIKRLATAECIPQALALILPHTPLTPYASSPSSSSSSSPQLTAQAYRLRGDLNMLLHVHNNPLPTNEDPSFTTPYMNEAEICYVKSHSLSEACSMKAQELEGRLAREYGVNEFKAFRPLSLLSRVGGDNSNPSFNYWNLSAANLVRLCDISKRKKDWASYFKRTSALLSKTLDHRRREEILAKVKLSVENEGDEELSENWARFSGEGVADAKLTKALNTFAAYIKGKQPEDLQRSIPLFSKAIVSTRLSGDLTTEARATANLATAYHHQGNIERSIRYYLESLASFRMLSNAKDAKDRVNESEKKILNALALLLTTESKDYASGRIFCLVQLKFAVSKQNLEILKGRLKECDKMIERGKGQLVEGVEDFGGEGAEEGGEEEEEEEEEEIENGKGDEHDDDLPPGPPC